MDKTREVNARIREVAADYPYIIGWSRALSQETPPN
jgi:hypothetical protein